jgi:arylsulfatase A-like enzyme
MCIPSRKMILTGRDILKIPSTHNNDTFAKNEPNTTIADTFRSAGFFTVCVTKIQNSYRPGHLAFHETVETPHRWGTRDGPDAHPETALKSTDQLLKKLDERAIKSDPFLIYYAPST